MPTVSVIIPQYHHEAYLMDAVQSIVNQTFLDWELIILNDDSGINLLPYERLDSRIQVFQTGGRKGQPYRLNQGIRPARGEYIAFLDADDIAIPQRLMLSIIFMKKHNLDMMYGDNIILKPDGRRYYGASTNWDPELLKKRTITCFSSIMVRREIALKCPFPEDVGQGNDRIWTIDVSRVTDAIARLPLPFYYHLDYTSQFHGKLYIDFALGRKINSFLARIEREYQRRKLQKEVDKWI